MGVAFSFWICLDCGFRLLLIDLIGLRLKGGLGTFLLGFGLYLRLISGFYS